MKAPTYSFGDVLCSITGPGGSLSLGNTAGPAEEGITVEASEETDTMQGGADGTVVHSLHMVKSGRVIVRLLKMSLVNAALRQMYSLQRASALTHAKNTIVITHLPSGEVYTCTDVAFAKMPANAWAKTAGVIDWEFNCGRIEQEGGSLLGRL